MLKAACVDGELDMMAVAGSTNNCCRYSTDEDPTDVLVCVCTCVLPDIPSILEEVLTIFD